MDTGPAEAGHYKRLDLPEGFAPTPKASYGWDAWCVGTLLARRLRAILAAGGCWKCRDLCLSEKCTSWVERLRLLLAHSHAESEAARYFNARQTLSLHHTKTLHHYNRVSHNSATTRTTFSRRWSNPPKGLGDAKLRRRPGAGAGPERSFCHASALAKRHRSATVMTMCPCILPLLIADVFARLKKACLTHHPSRWSLRIL